jgi:hypothetical protein
MARKKLDESLLTVTLGVNVSVSASSGYKLLPAADRRIVRAAARLVIENTVKSLQGKALIESGERQRKKLGNTLTVNLS